MRCENEARRGAAAAALLLLLGTPASAEPRAGSALRLDAAQAAVLEAHPELEAARAEQRALEAAQQQAALRPNPELRLDVEDVAGSGELRGVGEAQTTLRIVQLLELGGDRAARSALAAHRRGLTAFDLEARRLDLLAATANAFVAILVAQEELHHATELAELGASERAAAAERVRAGAALAVEETRARVAEREARAHEVRGRTELATARAELAALWGAIAPDFDTAQGELHAVSPAPPLEALLVRLARNPDLARFETERDERAASLALARARRVPDPMLGAGARHLAGSGGAALVFEVALPLPLFDRQQGAIAEAAARMGKLAAERAAAERTLRAALVAEHGGWQAAFDEIVAIRDEILPANRRALRELRAGHRDGRVSQLDVLTAQRAEFENVDRKLHLLGQYHRARIASERLVGGFVDELR